MITKYIVLTGASGFLGKHVLHSFLSGVCVSPTEAEDVQYQIYALYGGTHLNFQGAVENYAKSKYPHNTLCKIKTFSLDLSDSKAVDEWLDRELRSVPVVDVCIHLAAISNPSTCEPDPDLALAVNVPKHFFLALLEQKNCKRIIALSTDHVYPGTNPPYSEEKEGDSLKPINVYGATKYEMERFLLQNNHKNQVVVLRSSIMLGSKAPIAKEASKDTFLDFCASRKDKETLFWTDEKRSVIWIQDVVAVIRWFVAHETNDFSGIWNMGGPQSVSRFDMAKAVFDHFGYQTKFYLVPMKKGQEQAQKPKSGPPTPLDITMDSSKLEKLTHLTFENLPHIVQSTFQN